MTKHDPNSAPLPYGRQTVNDDDIAAVAAVLRGDWLTTGPAVETFENALAASTRAAHIVVSSSGTAALHLALLAAEIGPGDIVIVPANTFLATANTVRHVGAEVTFADVDPATGLMFTDHARAAFAATDQSRVRAVMPVHFAGQCADPAALHAFGREHDLAIIEDACHALGTHYMDSGEMRTVGDGTHADMSTFSFHPVKTITTGEGGAVATRDATFAERLRRFRNHGMSRNPAHFRNRNLALDEDGEPNPWYYEMAEPGFNYRASDLHCALGTSQLARLPEFIATRQKLVERYRHRMEPLAPLVTPLAVVPGCEPSWHLQVINIDFAALGRTRAQLMRRLHDRGIGTQVHYIPVPWQPYYSNRIDHSAFPGVAAYYDSCLSLPLFAAMSTDDVDRVVDALSSVLNGLHQ